MRLALEVALERNTPEGIKEIFMCVECGKWASMHDPWDPKLVGTDGKAITPRDALHARHWPTLLLGEWRVDRLEAGPRGWTREQYGAQYARVLEIWGRVTFAKRAINARRNGSVI